MAQERDLLLACLQILSEREKLSFSEHSIRSGLALDDEPLSPSVFAEAAFNAGFDTDLAKVNVDRLNTIVLPAVLILKDNEALVLHHLNDDGSADVTFPDKSEQTLDAGKLSTLYAGYAFSMQRKALAQSRDDKFGTRPRTEWLKQTLLRFKSFYVHILIAAFLTNLFVLVAPLFIMNVYDRVVPNQAILTLWVLAIGAATFFVFDLIARLLRSYLLDLVSKKADVLLSGRLFQHILNLRMEYKPKSTGMLAIHFNELSNLREFATSAAIIALIDLPFIVIFLIVIGIIAGPLVIIPIVVIPIVIVLSMLLEYPAQRLVGSQITQSMEKQAILFEAVSGLEAVKSYNAQNHFAHRWQTVSSQTAALESRSLWYMSLAVNIAIFAQQLTTIGVIIFGAYMIFVGQLSLGGLIAVTILTGRAVSLSQAVSVSGRILRSRTSMELMDKILNLPSEKEPDKNYLHRPRLKGNIEFKTVSFAYPEQRFNSINNLSLKLNAGERVGIIGRNGAGKTTLLKLITALYQPQQGSVLIDGTDNSEIDNVDLRHNIHYVGQDSVLFYGSVADNIRMAASNISDEELIKLAKLTGVMDFVNRDPHGFDMQVGERGEMLSSGQRQAVALARALANKPPILLLDDALNQVDNQLQAELINNLKDYSKDKTLVVVSHQLPILELVDRVAVMEQGIIIAEGPRERIIELVQTKSLGDYLKKAKQQAGKGYE